MIQITIHTDNDSFQDETVTHNFRKRNELARGRRAARIRRGVQFQCGGLSGLKRVLAWARGEATKEGETREQTFKDVEFEEIGYKTLILYRRGEHQSTTLVARFEKPPNSDRCTADLREV